MRFWQPNLVFWPITSSKLNLAKGSSENFAFNIKEIYRNYLIIKVIYSNTEVITRSAMFTDCMTAADFCLFQNL